MAAGVSEAAPIVFLSHASEDKESFAEPLGRALARLGMQPWLDKWEIKAGDSLVQKIFDEGLARSQAVVVIISEISVTKPWVREELDSATVSRIQRGTKLIPIRLDKVEMPERRTLQLNVPREGVPPAPTRRAGTWSMQLPAEACRSFRRRVAWLTHPSDDAEFDHLVIEQSRFQVAPGRPVGCSSIGSKAIAICCSRTMTQSVVPQS